MLEGLVIQHGANRYLVETGTVGEPEVWACTIAGRLRQGKRVQVRVAVIGDRVRLEPEADAEAAKGSIVEVLPRRNRISRPAPSGGRQQKQEQVVMANLDRLWVIASLDQPPLNLHFVDRVLSAARHQGVEAGLVLNKIDLPGARDPGPTRRFYEALGYPVLLCSAVSGEGVEELGASFSGGIGAFVGLSGVGKSSLINVLQPGLQLATKEVGVRSGQGRHTTTASRLYRLDCGGWLADTPGMRGFGLWGMTKGELGDTFVEFDAPAQECHFRDCLHIQEPGCGVRAALERGEVDEGRYRRYLGLLEELPEELDGWRDRKGGGRR
jgi:ribosome biogenesis GTPase